MRSSHRDRGSPVELFRVDVHGRRLSSNEAHARALGLARWELRGVHLSQPAVPGREEEIDVISRALERVRSSGEDVVVAFRRRFGNHDRRLEAHCSPELDDDDGVTAIIVLVRETQDGGPLEAQLSDARSLIEGIANSTDDMIAAVDPEFRFLYCNDAYRREFERLWGRAPEVGKSMTEAMAPWPSEQEKAREMWARALAGESFSVISDFGPTDAARRIYELHFDPMYAEDGEHIGAAHIVRDVTEQERTRKALAEARANVSAERDRLQAVLEILPVSVFIANAEGRIVLTNRTVASIWGRAAHTTSPDLYDQDYKAWWVETGERVRSSEWAIARALERGETSIAEKIEIETAEGEHRFILNYALPILDDSARTSGAVALNVDVTDLKRAETELQLAKDEAERANAAKTEFLAHMSHEIRTPVSGIIGMVDVILSRTNDPDVHEHLGLVKDAARSLLSVLGDILDLSRIESGAVEIELAPWSVRESVRSAVIPLEQSAIRKGLAFRLEIDEAVPEVLEADGRKIEQVIRNLVSNAIKYTSEGSVRVRVETARREVDPQRDGRAGLRIVVSDTGRGIPEDQEDAIFESFVRVRKSVRDADVEGAGLGLTITRRLLTTMGGTLSFESVPGVGSTFVAELELKILDEQPPVQPRMGREETLPSLDLLVAEDNSINAMVVKMTLEDAGHHVTLARNGAEAVDRVRDRLGEGRAFDVILMDVQMPKMDGFEATAAIRSIGGEAASVPVIVLTAFAMADDEARFRAAGMDGYVTKPTDFGALSDEIRRVFARR
ncbi:MAG: PAS domain-containing protein [Spirochaetota bacterium]